jgi:hypothetical protein
MARAGAWAAVMVLITALSARGGQTALASACTTPTTLSDFNGDGCSDLAIGVHGEDIGSVTDAGAMNVLNGDSTGIVTAGNQFWNQDASGVTDQAEQGDAFGRSREAGDFNGDGYADLAVGVYQESFPNLFQAGAVHILYGSASGLSTTGQNFFEEGVSGIPGPAQPGTSSAAHWLPATSTATSAEQGIPTTTWP